MGMRKTGLETSAVNVNIHYPKATLVTVLPARTAPGGFEAEAFATIKFTADGGSWVTMFETSPDALLVIAAAFEGAATELAGMLMTAEAKAQKAEQEDARPDLDTPDAARERKAAAV